MCTGLRQESIARENDRHLANPIIPDDILKGESITTVASGNLPLTYCMVTSGVVSDMAT